jgi:acetyltransferase-like isoleucine patch superfamily enzyme
MEDHGLSGLKNRVLQILARILPGEQTLRVWLHRARGVHIENNVKIGYDVVLETAYPELITIREGATVAMRATVIAHFKEAKNVVIGKDAFVGPCAVILPNVEIGDGAVVTAGSVVTASVPPAIMVRGNPALPIARCGVPLRDDVSYLEFSGRLRPIPPARNPLPDPQRL